VKRSMFRSVSMVLTLAIVALGAACGFDCDVEGEKQHFNDCDALQAAYDGLSSETQAAEQSDMLTCGELVGCEVQP
jgi:hypothetical protein